MSGAPVSFDRIIPEETQGPMPVGAPSTLASGSLDSFHHVEAVMKDENVSTGTLDSQDWEMVTEMVEDTENAATHFMQGKHVIDLEGPAPNLQDSIDTMMATMEKMKLGSTAGGVEAPSLPEGVASAAAVHNASSTCMSPPWFPTRQCPWKPKSWNRGPPRPRLPFCTICVMVRSGCMPADGEHMSPRKSHPGQNNLSHHGTLRKPLNAEHTPRIKVPTSWSFTCTRMKSLRTRGILACVPVGPI